MRGGGDCATSSREVMMWELAAAVDANVAQGGLVACC